MLSATHKLHVLALSDSLKGSEEDKLLLGEYVGMQGKEEDTSKY